MYNRVAVMGYFIENLQLKPKIYFGCVLTKNKGRHIFLIN